MNFKKAFPSRFINNIYLDSYNFSNYNDNINGEQMRKKQEFVGMVIFLVK